MRRWLVVLALAFPSPCSKSSPGGPADAADAAASASAIRAPSPSPSPPSSSHSDADRQALARAKQSQGVIEALVARGSLSDPARPGADASLSCASFADQKPALEKMTDPEAKTVIETTSKLCAFDVPLLVASDSLNQLDRPRSPSSTLLFCKSAQREIARARSVDPRDVRVRRLERRWAALCRDR